MLRMAKKYPGGKHTTPRKPVQIPETWIKLARQLAAKNEQPMLWYLLKLIGEAADKEGLDHPAYPWEEESS